MTKYNLLKVPIGVPPPLMTLFTNSEKSDSDERMKEAEIRMIEILREINWLQYTMVLDVSKYPDRCTYLVGLVDCPDYPHFIFHGKPIGSTQQMTRAVNRAHLVNNGNYLATLMNYYTDWARGEPRSFMKGCKVGFQLVLDWEMVMGQTRKNALATQLAPAPEADRSQYKDHEAFPSTDPVIKVLPTFRFNNKSVHFTRLIYDLLLKFSYDYVRTSGPESCSTVMVSHNRMPMGEPGGNSHRRCFRGTELVKFLIDQEYVSNDLDAREICQVLMDLLVFRQVERKEIQLFNLSTFLYRFSTHDNPLLLNKLLCFPRRHQGRMSPLQLLKKLHKDLVELYRENKTSQGYDLRKIYNEAKFLIWRISVCELQHVYTFDTDVNREGCPLHPINPFDIYLKQSVLFCRSPCGQPTVTYVRDDTSHNTTRPSYLKRGDKSEPQSSHCLCRATIPEEELEKLIKSFFINLYNLGVLHSFIQVGVPVSHHVPASFFMKVGYVLGACELHLSGIFSGILRLGRNATKGYGSHNPEANGRYPYQLKTVDPRVHFAIQDCQKDVPIDLFIIPESVDEQLDKLAHDFVMNDENYTVVVPECLIVKYGLPNISPENLLSTSPARSSHGDPKVHFYLNHIFETYETDFGCRRIDVLHRISGWLSGEKKMILHKVLELYHSSECAVGVKYKTANKWSKEKFGIANAGNFPFTEEKRQLVKTSRRRAVGGAAGAAMRAVKTNSNEENAATTTTTTTTTTTGGGAMSCGDEAKFKDIIGGREEKGRSQKNKTRLEAKLLFRKESFI